METPGSSCRLPQNRSLLDPSWVSSGSRTPPPQRGLVQCRWCVQGSFKAGIFQMFWSGVLRSAAACETGSLDSFSRVAASRVVSCFPSLKLSRHVTLALFQPLNLRTDSHLYLYSDVSPGAGLMVQHWQHYNVFKRRVEASNKASVNSSLLLV